MSDRLPVKVLSGFLGAGKTTLPDAILNDGEGHRIAIVVEDMSEVNVDADPVCGGAAGLLRIHETLVEMIDGYICCPLRDDLPRRVRRLAERGRFDHLVIEGTDVDDAA